MKDKIFFLNYIIIHFQTNAIADSMSLTLGGWLGIPTLPIVVR